MSGSRLQPAAPTSYIQPTVAATVLQSPRVSQARMTSRAAVTKPKVQSVYLSKTGMVAMSFSALSPDFRGGMRLPAPKPGFDWYNAASTAFSFYWGGRVAGTLVGCGFGALATLPTGGAGCIPGMAIGAATGGILGAAGGFFLGGNNAKYSDIFDWGPDQLIMPSFK